ncbi:MAG: alpha/beta fold hydrolase [Rhodobacteraceae bacterium]|nr:alpha/beta fold hydrolase [Paracoccaceae bacterium]
MAPTMGGTEQAAIRRGYAEGRFGQIHYRVAGSHGVRSPLLMLHPSPLSGYVFENLMSEMGRDRYVIAPDTPGFGMSDPPAQPPEIADYAATMLEFVAGLGLGIVDVLGYHTGSLTSVEMAQQAPNVVRKIVMISATTFTPEETEKFRAQYKPKTVDERIGGISEGWRRFRDDFWRMEPNDHRAVNVYLEGRRNPDWSSWGHRAAFNYDLSGALKKSAHQILVLNPQDDLWEYTPRAAKLLKNGEVKNLPGWTHGFLDAETAAVGRMLREFLDH